MNDKEILQSRLKTERPAVPEGFAQRQDALLGSLRRDPQPAVCRMPRLAIVLAVVIALAGTIAIAEVSGLKLLDFASASRLRRRGSCFQGIIVAVDTASSASASVCSIILATRYMRSRVACTASTNTLVRSSMASHPFLVSGYAYKRRKSGKTLPVL